MSRLSSQQSSATGSGSPEGEALLRERLSLLGKVGVSIALPFNIVGIALDLLPGDRTLGDALVALDNLVPMTVTLLLVIVWRLPRYLARAGLVRLDFVFLPVIDALFYWAASHIDTTPPAALATQAFVFAALARAIVVPSTPKRTLLATALGGLSTAAGSWLLLEGAGELRVPQTALTVLWHSGAVVLATVTSSVIYGLRRAASEALELGQYTLLEKIGAGGMGEVYLARHALLRRPTAVKLLPAGRDSRTHVERFEREAQLTSQLTHPNTISVYDYGRTPDGRFYYAMEYLDGLTLQELVSGDGPQAPGRVARLIHAVCEALDEAHGVGLIHRDVKPANVFVCERGGRADVVKVVDFGLVKATGSLAPSVTATNAVIGTPLYISPESVDRPNEVEARSDLYSVGCLAYFLLTGEPPFVGQSAIEICMGHLHKTPAPPSDRLAVPLSPAFDALVLDCLAKRAADRPGSAKILCERLSLLPEFQSFTDSDARSWWQKTGRALKADRPSAISTLPATIGIDVQHRA